MSGACSSDSTPSGGAGTQPAVLVAAQIVTPDDYLTYVGLFPDVPQGDVKLAAFREFGNANVSVHDGRVFVEQDGVMQRFEVGPDFKLVEGPRFTWADFGIATANASYTVFISKTRAYTFSPQLGVVIIWDPDQMKRTGVIEFEFPVRPDGYDTWASDGFVIGDKVIWNVFSGSFDAPKAHPALTLAIADANTDAPLTFVEDSRCLPGGPSFVDDNGDYYVHGAGYFGFFYAYGEPPTGTTTCALRVKSGQTVFDPTFKLDYATVTGGPVNTPWIKVSGGKYVTRVWDPAVPFPESADDFWTGEALHAELVDQNAGTSTPYPDLDGILDIDGVTRIVDGVSYFQVSETGYVEAGSSDVVELRPEGTVPKFHLDGAFLLNLERVR
jgi:hypothetical protein